MKTRTTRKTPTPIRHEQTTTQFRRAAGAAVTTDALRRLVWDSGVDIDEMVDRFARSHQAEGYREPGLQKAQLDALADRLVGQLAPQEQVEVREILNGWYARYLLAADVGFELGLGVAQALPSSGSLTARAQRSQTR